MLPSKNVLQHDGFDLNHLLQSVHRALGAEAGHLVPVEGLLSQTVVAVAADHAGAGIDGQRKGHRLLHILGQNTGGQTVAGVVGNGDRLLQRLKADDGEHQS